MRRKIQRQNLKDLRQGQQQAWQAVISQHYRQIYRFMAYLTNDKNIAEDLTQETFASAWANIGRFNQRASLATWLHRIAYNKFIDSERALSRRAEIIAALKKEKCDITETSNPLGKLITDENSHLLYEAIHKLELQEYIVIVLHYIQSLSFRQMAKVLDTPTGTVKWRTSRTLKKLKKLLTDRV